ncbi:MAG TPA: hypothetical protein VI141_06665 [Acidimicrobiia bacterium]
MGQTVVIRDSVIMGDVLVVSTDRSFTGQDGHAMAPDTPGEAVPGQLGEDLFGLGLDIDHVYVQQNTISVRRPAGWDSGSVDPALEAIASFLRHYPDPEGDGS